MMIFLGVPILTGYSFWPWILCEKAIFIHKEYHMITKAITDIYSKCIMYFKPGH